MQRKLFHLPFVKGFVSGKTKDSFSFAKTLICSARQLSVSRVNYFPFAPIKFKVLRAWEKRMPALAIPALLQWSEYQTTSALHHQHNAKVQVCHFHSIILYLFTLLLFILKIVHSSDLTCWWILWGTCILLTQTAWRISLDYISFSRLVPISWCWHCHRPLGNDRLMPC